MKTATLRTAEFRRNLLACVAAGALAGNSIAPALADDTATTTPIKHVIVIIGENRTFDHIFATYKPVNKGEKVWNLLSEGIVKADGSPGPNYGKALQYQGGRHHDLSVDAAQEALCRPCRRRWSAVRRRPTSARSLAHRSRRVRPAIPRRTLAAADSDRNGLADDYVSISVDRRHGPDRGDPGQAHRLRRTGRQQSAARPVPDHRPETPLRRLRRRARCIASTRCGSSSIATPRAAIATNGSGCLADLFPWVEVTIGAGSNGTGAAVAVHR